MWSISKNFGSNDAYTIRLELSSASQSVENNQTALHFACWLISNRSSASFTGQARTDTLTVAGVTVNPAHGYYVLNGGGSVLLWELDMTVSHDSDGSFNEKYVSCGVLIDTTFSSSGYIGTVTAEGTMTLTTIPRASTMTVSGSTLGSDVTFNISAASAAFTHSLTYDFGDAYGTLLDYKPAGTHRLPMPLSLASQFPNAKSGTVTYTLYTWNGVGVSVGVKTYTATLTIPSSAAPSVASGWASATYYNTDTAAASIAAFVQGYSRAQVTFDPSKITTKYGATVKRYKIACGSVTDTASPYLTGVLTGTSATITCTVEDSRGYTASETLTVGLNAYKKPALSDVALYRADEDGTANRAGLCIYARAKLTYSSIGGRNSCSLKGFFRLQSGNYPAAGTEMTSEAGILLTVAAAVTSTYVAKIEAKDSLGNTASYEATIPTDNVAFHIREGGQGAAFGKYSEEDDLLDVAWAARVRKALRLDVPLAMESGGTGANTADGVRTSLLDLGYINGDLDNMTSIGVSWCDFSYCTNAPFSSGYGYVIRDFASGSVTQTAFRYDIGMIYRRSHVNGAWTKWRNGFDVGAVTATTYPPEAGIYVVTGAEIFQNMTPNSLQGVLVIFHAGYAAHLYIDSYFNLYYGFSGNTFAEPAKWYTPSVTQKT